MNTIFKYATAAALTGALALAAASPSEARNGRNAAAIGFGVGAVAGAVIAGSAYNNGYYGTTVTRATPMATLPVTRMPPVTPMTRMLMSRRLPTRYAYAPAYRYSRYGYDSPYLDPHRTNNFSISSQR